MSRDELIAAVFNCSYCEGMGLPFLRCSSGKWHRFPPIIGALGHAPLLFGGINPRVSDSNRALHNLIVDNYPAFERLSRNRVNNVPYIARQGLERHYALHIEVAERLFPGKAFESVAAVTELHFCASKSSSSLPRTFSKCFEQYFDRVLTVASPFLVFAVGKTVERTLRVRLDRAGLMTWRSGKAPVITLPHPNAYGPNKEQLEAAVEVAARHLAQHSFA